MPSFECSNCRLRTLRGYFGLCLVLLLSGCAASLAPNPSVVIVTQDGRTLDREQALALLRQADHVLLGELHDNPMHHRERAALLEALAPQRPVVVFEQFARDADAALAEPVAGDLEAWLDRAGFDRKGWGWPLHRPVIESALALGLPLRGGNLPRDQVRRVAREGVAAAPPALQERLRQGLPAPAADALGRALRDGHCGRLPDSLLPRLTDAQVARDLAMTDALAQASADGSRPTVLIAGNGHVRRDHGVPLWLAQSQPAARVLSVGFLERSADGAGPAKEELALHDLVWITARIERTDPCLNLPSPPRQRAGSS